MPATPVGDDTARSSIPTATLERSKVATSIVFALNGWAFATWASRIPATRDLLGLDPGPLGVLLLCGAAGSLVGLPVAGKLADRLGAAGAVRFGACFALAGLAFAGLTVGVFHSVPLTALGLFVTTFGLGTWDVSMNLEGAIVEHHLGRTIMPRYHAAFSLGTVLAALLGAGLSAIGVPVLVHFAVTALVLLFAALAATRSFLPHGVEAEEKAAEAAAEATKPASSEAAAQRSAWTEPRTLLVGLVVLVAAFTEGTANDWISVAFIDGYHLPQYAGVLAFATFLSFMTIGRVFGTNLVDTYGRVPVLRVLFVMAGLGSVLVVFGTSWLAYIGAAIWGFGVSLGFPLGMSAAADDPERAPARLSVVATIGYGAFLVGPPALGFLGDHFGVLRALSVVSAMVLLALLVLPAMAKPEDATTAQVEGAAV